MVGAVARYLLDLAPVVAVAGSAMSIEASSVPALEPGGTLYERAGCLECHGAEQAGARVASAAGAARQSRARSEHHANQAERAVDVPRRSQP